MPEPLVRTNTLGGNTAGRLPMISSFCWFTSWIRWSLDLPASLYLRAFCEKVSCAERSLFDLRLTLTKLMSRACSWASSFLCSLFLLDALCYIEQLVSFVSQPSLLLELESFFKVFKQPGVSQKAGLDRGFVEQTFDELFPRFLLVDVQHLAHDLLRAVVGEYVQTVH